MLYHRPVSSRDGNRGNIWLSRSPDLHHWTAPEPVMASREGPWWDAARIGLGPAPIETEHGWLAIYHGVKQMPAGPLYRAGLVLFDLDNPARVLRRSPAWVMGPAAEYEKRGDVPNVVFPTRHGARRGHRRAAPVLRRRGFGGRAGDGESGRGAGPLVAVRVRVRV